MSKTETILAGVRLKNPVLAAGGTFGFGREYEAFFDIERLGGIVCKGLTLEPREGNPPPRVAETPAGMLNSVGLQNPGVEAFVKRELPRLRKKNLAVVANLAGSTPEDYAAAAKLLDAADVDMVELNISCPNVKHGGMAFGTDPTAAAQLTRTVRKVLRKPLMVKLSPAAVSVAEVAKAVEAEGADAVSLINTLPGMRVDIRTRRPVLRNNVGGLSGPAVLPVALRMVWEVYRAVSVPVVGMGGISSWEDAVEMMLCGASAVQVGTAFFTDPLAGLKIVEGLEAYADRCDLRNLSELVGGIKPW